MKKFVAILFTVFMLVHLVACAGSNEDTLISKNNNNISETDEENELINNIVESESINEVEELKILVAYFSATHTTEGIAKYVADELSADIYEIVPEQPYTDEDLNYHNNNSLSTIEMNDTESRPTISGSVQNMEQYDIVFIGYPIWWGEAPRIVNTFIESYDFSDKTIIPFCTSGSSGIGSSAINLQKLTNGAEWLSGQRFSSSTSKDSISSWIEGLHLDIN